MDAVQDLGHGIGEVCDKQDAGSALRFQYDKLSNPAKQIRLLKLDQSDDDDDPCISGTLITVDRSESHDYIAIFYTWGDPASTRELMINGRKFEVTSNCWYALWQVRYHGADVRTEDDAVHEHRVDLPIWIDAICINQTGDLEEKSAQVANMGALYRNAVYVAACVGEQGSEDYNLVNAIDAYACDRTVANAEAVFSTYRDLMPNLQTFFARPYFSRLWAVQEFLCAANVYCYCGTERFRFVYLWDLIYDLKTPVNEEIYDGLQHPFLNNAPRSIDGGEGVWDTALTRQMRRYGDFHCLDPRDKVYALLDLVDWQACYGREPLEVDYSISLGALAIRVLELSLELPERDVENVPRSRLSLWDALPPITNLWPHRNEHADFLKSRKAQRNQSGRDLAVEEPFTRPALKFFINGTAVLAQDEHGRLTTRMRTVQDGADIEWLLERLDISFEQLMKSRGRHTKVFDSTGEVCAVVPSGSCTEDVIIPLGGPYNCCGLVCRKTRRDRLFSIVGQAILHPRCLPVKQIDLPLSQIDMSDIRTRVCFDAEDFLAFLVQDATWTWLETENRNVPRWASEEPEGILLAREWEARLSTPVTRYQDSSFVFIDSPRE